jgi:hypothetical protein
MRLYLLWVIGIAILLMVGDPTVRTLAALVLAVGAWPLWRLGRLQTLERERSAALSAVDQFAHRLKQRPGIATYPVDPLHNLSNGPVVQAKASEQEE